MHKKRRKRTEAVVHKLTEIMEEERKYDRSYNSTARLAGCVLL